MVGAIVFADCFTLNIPVLFMGAPPVAHVCTASSDIMQRKYRIRLMCVSVSYFLSNKYRAHTEQRVIFRFVLGWKTEC